MHQKLVCYPPMKRRIISVPHSSPVGGGNTQLCCLSTANTFQEEELLFCVSRTLILVWRHDVISMHRTLTSVSAEERFVFLIL